MGPCSDLGPVSSLAHGNGIGGKLLKRRGMTSKNSNSSSTAPCFLAALAFAALGLILNFFFLLHLEERSTISSPASGLLRQGKLAVVVPAHRGDLDRALASLSRWPTACSPTLSNVDLILYYAAAPDDKSVRILPSLSSTGGRCFAHTQVVYAYLTDEVRGYCSKRFCSTVHSAIRLVRDTLSRCEIHNGDFVQHRRHDPQNRNNSRL